MSISGALSNALSGLTAASRSADVTASNIANVMTEGYGVREVVLSPRSGGDEGGVQIVGIRRLVDQVLLNDRRDAEANLANTSTLETFYSRIQVSVGLPTDTGSLSDRLAELESSLAAATQAPESDAVLQGITSNLKNLATRLNQLGDAVQLERSRADSDIATEVENLNATLEQIEIVNSNIRKYLVQGHDVAALLDQRQALVDKVSTLIPVTELDRGQGSIALMTFGGTMLLDGTAAELEFTNSPVVTEHMSLAGGTLSGLTINGRAVDIASSPSSISGGRLDALFNIRDVDAVEFQAKLDGFARDLIERFEDPTVDPTRSATDPGLFTDNDAMFDASDEVGLAQRISVNDLVDPVEGGDVWRLRDGLGAAAAGDEGRTAGLMRLSDALSTYQSVGSAAFSTGLRTASTLAADLSSDIGSNLERAKSENAFSQAQYNTLKEMELGEGVDTDAEMQRLLLIEQAYAANARVVQVADEMLDWLMRI